MSLEVVLDHEIEVGLYTVRGQSIAIANKFIETAKVNKCGKVTKDKGIRDSNMVEPRSESIMTYVKPTLLESSSTRDRFSSPRKAETVCVKLQVR